MVGGGRNLLGAEAAILTHLPCQFARVRRPLQGCNTDRCRVVARTVCSLWITAVEIEARPSSPCFILFGFYPTEGPCAIRRLAYATSNPHVPNRSCGGTPQGSATARATSVPPGRLQGVSRALRVRAPAGPYPNAATLNGERLPSGVTRVCQWPTRSIFAMRVMAGVGATVSPDNRI